VFFKNSLDLREVGLDDVSHFAEALKQGQNLFLQSFTELSFNIRYHSHYSTLEFFLVCRVLSHQSVLELQDCLHDQLEIIELGFFFIGNDVIVLENLGNDFMKLHERVGKDSFDLCDVHYFLVL
jgi:hypothetical protein